MNIIAGWINTSVVAEQAESLLKQLAKNSDSVSEWRDHLAWVAPESQVKQRDPMVLITNLKHYPQIDEEQLFNVCREQNLEGLDALPYLPTLYALDYAKKRVLLATDPIGLQSVYYAQTTNGLVFGSSADAVIAHPEVTNDLSLQSIFNYVYFHHCPSPTTIYQQVKKLEGGQYLLFDNGRITIKRYWMPRFSETLSGSVAEAKAQLLNRLQASVQARVADKDRTGAFLSGGLDSSSVSGALSQVFPGEAKTFSMGFAVDGYDEIEFAQMAVKQFNTQQHQYYVTPEDTLRAVPLIAAHYDEPFGNSSALAAYYCAKLAKDHGVNVMLAGDGGDEIFAGNERYLKQLIFEHWHRVPGLIQKPLQAVLFNLPTTASQINLIHKAKRYIEQANTTMPDRMQDYNFLHRHLASEVFNQAFVDAIDTDYPLSTLRETYHAPEQADPLNRMLYMDWKTTLHDNDLVKVNRMCELVGVDVYYPLLDYDMVELSCAIPSSIKIHKNQLRWFYKQAMEGFLPHGIIHKTKHGFGLPFGIWLKDYVPLQEMAYDSINDLKKRHYFQSQFLDHAIEMHRGLHASYYGELIWILMMLELWLQGHSDS